MMRIRLPAVGLFLLISSNAWADLRTYDVDAQYRQEVFEALQRVLITDPTAVGFTGNYGRVSLLPSGQILVDAAPETLAQVEEVLRAIAERPAGAAPRVSLRYWAVLGIAPGTDAPGLPNAAAVPDVLDGVLAELARVHGELEFRVIGTAAVMTQSGQDGEVDGMTLSVRQRAYVQGQTLNAEIEMNLRGNAPNPIGQFRIGDLTVQTSLRRSEFVVLGESMLQGGGLEGPVFYIVHWPEGE